MGDTGRPLPRISAGIPSLAVMRHVAVDLSRISLLVVIVTLAVPIVDTSVRVFPAAQ